MKTLSERLLEKAFHAKLAIERELFEEAAARLKELEDAPVVKVTFNSTDAIFFNHNYFDLDKFNGKRVALIEVAE